MMFKDNVKILTPEELGCTEDEYNNFLIDMFNLMKDVYPQAEITSMSVSPAVTVTITPSCHSNYIDLEDQNY